MVQLLVGLQTAQRSCAMLCPLLLLASLAVHASCRPNAAPLHLIAHRCSSPCQPQAKCCVHPVPFYLSEAVAADGLTIRQQLDVAVDEAKGFGIPIKVGASLSLRPVCQCGGGGVRNVLALCRAAQPSTQAHT